jgi:NAD(P)-dependent dehydrogenase (short-subunit alcohol dehydrogenase family)
MGVRTVALDLADLRRWTRSRRPLGILVANAGIMALPKRTVTDADWEKQLATNFLGHFALAGALHAALGDAGSARIVVVSSGAHRWASFDFDAPYFEQRPYDLWVAHGQSKTADVLFAVGTPRWAVDGITANALDPGFILPNLRRNLDDDTMRALA